MRIGSRDFATTGHTYIMGILNVTPDSFSDGGKFNQIDAALIGGESTRPWGYTKISDEEETGRVVPVIEAVKKEFGIPISVDTYKSGVAEAAAQAGADLINDIWGLKYDPHMSEVIAKSGLACCLMHNRDNTEYRNFMEDMKQDLRETIALAKAAGIADDKIILDLPAAERVEGTSVTPGMAVEAGCMFVRVHDVKENHRAIQMAEAILDRK